ncbi:MAG: single-stranded DNA-binding protein [Actinomycetia bacterium]|nr:single-stranded DNA-binding protein [Actinomycetes bacterium]
MVEVRRKIEVVQYCNDGVAVVSRSFDPDVAEVSSPLYVTYTRYVGTARTSLVKGSVMDLNLIVVAGRLSAEPELITFASGTKLLRLLVTVRSEHPRRRIDVLPVVLWDPGDDVLPDRPCRGLTVWVAGSVQRRFWSAGDGRTSKVEIVAHDVQVREPLVSDEEESDAA